MTKHQWKRLTVHRWLANVKITESVRADNDGPRSYRRFTATIHGWRNVRLAEGFAGQALTQAALGKAQQIREKIEDGDEGVFSDPNDWDVVGVCDTCSGPSDTCRCTEKSKRT